MSERLVLAVDGGNSKTDVAILDDAGRVLGTWRGPGASFSPIDHDRSIADLERSVRAAARAAGASRAHPAGPSNARRAASTAASTSALCASGIVPIGPLSVETIVIV